MNFGGLGSCERPGRQRSNEATVNRAMESNDAAESTDAMVNRRHGINSEATLASPLTGQPGRRRKF